MAFNNYYAYDDWGYSNSSDSETESDHGAQTVEEEESGEEAIKLSPSEEMGCIEEYLEVLLRKDPRFLASKEMTRDDFEKLRYEIVKENPELSKAAYNRKTLMKQVWPNLLVGAFNDVSEKDSDVLTDDRREDDEFSLSINTVADMQPAIGEGLKKHRKSEKKKAHHHRTEKARLKAEAEKLEGLQKKEVERLSVEKLGQLYLKKHGGRRYEKFGSALYGQEDEMAHRHLERILFQQQFEKSKPILALPSLIKKYHVISREELSKTIGPGCYDPDYYTQVQKAKRFNLTKGAYTSVTTRFPYDEPLERKVKERAITPQGEFQNPFVALEKADVHYKHPGNKTSFEGGIRCFRKIKPLGAPVGPGTYETKSSIQELLNKKVSNKGPYKLFTGPRDKISFGYNKTRKIDGKLGPGSYFNSHKETINSRLNTPYTKFKGKFSPLLTEELEYQTGERNTVVTPMWPRGISSQLPGPGTYEYAMKHSLGSNGKTNKYSFNNSSPARPQFRWSPESEMGPMRYRLRKSFKLLYNIKGNGLKSVFNSNATVRLPFKDYKLHTERLRGKDIPAEELSRKSEH